MKQKRLRWAGHATSMSRSPILLPDGRRLVTLLDAGLYIQVLNHDKPGSNLSLGRRPSRNTGSFTEDLAREHLMANKFQGMLWFVSYDLPRRENKRSHTRATETFPNEQEAKKFARGKLAETLFVNAGTINPHLPRRTVASARMLEWLEDLDKDDLA